MIYLGKHRVLKEIDKYLERGQIIHFLTGDGINDNFFYSLYDGAKNMADTLRDYYLGGGGYDYFVHIVSATGAPICFKCEGGQISDIDFDKIVPPPKISSPFELDEVPAQTDSEKQGETIAHDAAGYDKNVVDKLEEAILKNTSRYLIFLENFEWTANLYEAQADTTWIAKIKNWENLRNVMIVVTIKDFELLKKYNFSQKDIFIGFPSAEEIRYAYLRYILRNTDDDYVLNIAELDEIAHGMSVGEKTLCACMRILRKVVQENPRQLSREDFNKSIEHGIEEKVPWEKVRLSSETKAKIMEAVNSFMAAGEDDRARHGMIFSGPPGTGKTLIAKSLASEKQCFFLAPTLAELKGEYVGHSSAKIKRIFDRARANEPTIIFIDEADTVFPSRAHGAGDSDSYAMDMVNQFLQEIDGAKTGLQKIFVIAATNRPEAVDEAIKSRLGNPEEIPLPSKQMRRLIFEDNFSTKDAPFELSGKIFEEFLLNKSEKMSGRDIKNFVKALKETAARRGISIGNTAETMQLIEEAFVEAERFFIHDVVSRGIFTATNIVAPHENRKRLSDIIGYENQKRQIIWQAEYIEASEARKNEYAQMKVEPQKGVLLYGPPGNGKSELAEAVAGERGFYFFKVLSKDFAAGFSSEQIKRLDSIFSEIARFSKLTEQKGIVLFFDEFDSLAGKRNLNQVVRGSLLNYIADEKNLRGRDSKILFIAATNFFDDIDDAMKRKGRIDAHIFMDNPTEADAVKILDAFIRSENVVEVASANFTATAYERLVSELRRNYLRSRYNLDDLKKVPADIREGITQDVNSQRPSGADLKTFYRELKEIAFRENSRRNGKLLFSDAVLSRRFSF